MYGSRDKAESGGWQDTSQDSDLTEVYSLHWLPSSGAATARYGTRFPMHVTPRGHRREALKNEARPKQRVYFAAGMTGCTEPLSNAGEG